MKKTNTNTTDQPKKKFEGYEEARESKDEKDPAPSSKKSVDAATDRLHPDENSLDRG